RNTCRRNAMATAMEQIRGDAGDGGGASGVKPTVRPGEEGATGGAAPAPVSRPSRPFPPHRVTRIAALSRWYETGRGEMARSYELLLVFTWRQIGVQYKQAVLGIGWAVLSPLLSTVVFTFVFGKLGGMPSDGTPYPVFVLSGIITWQYFGRGLSQG